MYKQTAIGSVYVCLREMLIFHKCMKMFVGALKEYMCMHRISSHMQSNKVAAISWKDFCQTWTTLWAVVNFDFVLIIAIRIS